MPLSQTSARFLASFDVFGGLFFGYAGLSALIPVLPLFIKQNYAVGDTLVGTGVTATALAALLSRPFFGMAADRYGHKPIMALGASGITATSMAFFLPLGFAGLIAVRLLAGLAEAALFTAGAVWIVATTPASRRGLMIGRYGISMWAGIGFGSYAGVALLPFGYGWVWLFAAAAPLIGLALVASATAPRPPEAPQPLGLQLQIGAAALPGTALAFAAAGYVVLATFSTLMLAQKGIDNGGAVLSVFSLTYAGTRFVIGGWPDKYGPYRVALWSALAEAVGLALITLATGKVLALLGALVMGTGFSLLHPSLALMVVNAVAPARRGAALGAYTAFWDLGLAAWGPITGAVAGHYGYGAAFTLCVFCPLLTAAIVVALRRQPAVSPEG